MSLLSSARAAVLGLSSLDVVPSAQGTETAGGTPAAGSWRLPNGLVVAGINQLDTRVLYNEVFESDMYWRHGIALRDGDTVLDVGANIGMYSLCLSRRFAGLRIHAFEPIPRVFDALATNARLHMDAGVVIHPYALSCHDGRETFVFDRFLSYAGSSHLHELRKVLPRSVGGAQSGPFAPSRWVTAILDELQMTGVVQDGAALRTLRRLLRRTSGRAVVVTGWLAFYSLLVLRRALFLSRVDVEVRTLSRVKQELGLDTVALAKIDVEGAELDVLRGVRDEDWGAFRQLVVEVHDVDDRLALCRDLLASRGFEVVVEAEPRPARRLLRIYQIYARRRA